LRSYLLQKAEKENEICEIETVLQNKEIL